MRNVNTAPTDPESKAYALAALKEVKNQQVVHAAQFLINSGLRLDGIYDNGRRVDVTIPGTHTKTCQTIKIKLEDVDDGDPSIAFVERSTMGKGKSVKTAKDAVALISERTELLTAEFMRGEEEIILLRNPRSPEAVMFIKPKTETYWPFIVMHLFAGG